MAWWNDYDRSYYGGYYGRPYYGRTGYGRDYYGYGYGPGYDQTYHVPPERSPTYGRGADQAARRYARMHGYDTGFTVEPGRERGGMRWGGTGRRGYDFGTYGYGGGTRGNLGYRGYDWGYRW